eukprot:TRINITY_DN349_c0_g1_i1.p1 TRINITY_DN349_c0_g1~~TRINITY_DN349_c0_g1_i1.p1  ORF type:complete len:128 (-),score=26.99 TRINITY_DN349_c0_g1_i1:33-416(-)
MLTIFVLRLIHVALEVELQFRKLTCLWNLYAQMKHLWMAAIALEGLGGILFIFGSTLGAYLLLTFLAIMTPIKYDFYNYDVAKPEYVTEFMEFLKNLALFGALLFFVGMKNSFAKKPKKKTVKSKTN